MINNQFSLLNVHIHPEVVFSFPVQTMNFPVQHSNISAGGI